MSVAAATHGMTGQRNRAEWALFTLHYRRLLVPLAAVYYGLLIVMHIYGYGLGYYKHYGPKDLQQISMVLDGMVIALAALFALPLGTAAFSRAFKEQQILFFHALPIGRRRQWLILMASTIAAAITTYAVALILRPGTFKFMFGEQQQVFVVVLLVSALLFAAGACFSLVFTRPVAVYASAIVVLLATMTATAALILAPYRTFIGVKSSSARGFVDPIGSQAPVGLMVSIVALITVTFLICSMAFYVRGEFVTMRTQMRNFGIALLAGPAVALIVTPAAMSYISRHESLETESWFASAEGGHATALSRAPHYPWRARLRIIDFDSGRTTAEIAAPDILIQFPFGDEVVAAFRDTSTIARKRNDRLAVFSRDGRLVRSVELPDQEVVELFPTAAHGPLTVISDDGSAAHVYEWDPHGPLRELAHAAVDHPVWAPSTRNTVILANRVEQLRAWRLSGGQAEELPWAKATSQQLMPQVTRGIAFPDRDALFRHLEKELPLPRDPGDEVVYAVPALWVSRGEMTYVWAARIKRKTGFGSVSVLAPNARSWRVVAASVPLMEHDRPNNEPVATDYQLMELAMADRNNRLFYIDGSSGRTVARLYDAPLDRTIDVTSFKELPRGMHVRSRGQLDSLSALSVGIDVTPDRTQEKPIAAFLYDGKLTALSKPIEGPLGGRRPDGTLIVDTNKGFVVVAPNGARRLIRLRK